MPRPENIFDVLQSVAGVVPGAFERQREGRNKRTLADLEVMLQQGKQQARQANEDRNFQLKLDELLADQQPDPFEAGKLKGQELDNLLKQLRIDEFGKPKPPPPDAPEDPQQATKDLISQLVRSRGAKTKDVRGIKKISQPNFLESLLFGSAPDTTFAEKPEKVPFSAQELQAFMESLNTAFGVDQTPTSFPAPVAETTGVSQQTLSAKRKRLAELKAKAGN